MLAFVVHHESAVAIRHWWGVSKGVIWRWRKPLEVTRINNEGTHRLVCAASDLGAEAMSERGLADKEMEQYGQRALDMNLGRFLQPGYHDAWWTPEEVAVLGTMSDEQVTKKVKRSTVAVRHKRMSPWPMA